jgi:SPP1 family predicted phage head-tail adaptor
MKAGRMSETVTIERETETVSPAGTVTLTWATITTRKAELIQAGMTELLKPFGEEEQSAIVFRVRYVADVLTTDRLTYCGQHYNIRDIKEIGRRRGLDLRCERIATCREGSPPRSSPALRRSIAFLRHRLGCPPTPRRNGGGSCPCLSSVGF